MSSNKSVQPQLSTANALFFPATFKGRTVAIRKNTDFVTTIASIRRAFPILGSLHPSRIRILARFSEFGNKSIEINELWAEALPMIIDVDILIGDPVDQASGPAGAKFDEIFGSSEHIVVHIRDTHGYTEGLRLPLLSTSTVQQLKTMIAKHSNRLSPYLILSYEEYSCLEDHKQLYQYDIRNGGTVSVFTEFEVHLNAVDDARCSVIITTSASVSVLRLLARAQASENTGFNPFEQVMTCAGEILDDNQKLGSYTQIVPGCEIFFNKATISLVPYQLGVRSENPQGGNTYYMNKEITTYYSLLPSSTILDLKLLMFNKTQVPLPRQVLELQHSYGSYSSVEKKIEADDAVVSQTLHQKSSGTSSYYLKVNK